MIRIKKGSNEFIVSNQSYKDIYKPLGYVIIEEGKETAKVDSKISTNAENKYIEEEKMKQLEISSDNDVVNSKQLKTEIGEDIEEDYGFTSKRGRGRRKQG